MTNKASKISEYNAMEPSQQEVNPQNWRLARSEVEAFFSNEFA